MKNSLKFVQSVLLSAIVVCVFVPAITIAAELEPALKAWLKDTFFHHWVGKGILSIIIFACVSALLSFLPRKVEAENVSRLLLILSLSALASVTAICGFFVWEFFLA